MMKQSMLLIFLLIAPVGATAQDNVARGQGSVIVEAMGEACMGRTRSRDETEKLARSEAEREALRKASVYVSAGSRVEDGRLSKDVIELSADADLRILSEDLSWDVARKSGNYVDDCCTVTIRAEATPDEERMRRRAEQADMDDPSGPLTVRLWTDKQGYRCSEKVFIYLKANKPFYGRVLHRDARGAVKQLLPNPHRDETYFYGGVVYVLPDKDDRFDIEACPPLGKETVALLAATKPLGSVELRPNGPVFAVEQSLESAVETSRGIRFPTVSSGDDRDAEFAGAEFATAQVEVEIRP